MSRRNVGGAPKRSEKREASSENDRTCAGRIPHTRLASGDLSHPNRKSAISRFSLLATRSLGVPSLSLVTLLCAASADGRSAAGAIPDFAPDDHTAWFPDRPAGDDFLPPESGPGPVLADPAHPYTPNDEGRNTGIQPTYRIADLTNPILKPWAAARMKKANDEVLAGGVPFVARERCWPAGVPGFDIMRRVAPVWVVQSPKEVLLIWPSDQQVRHVYLNMPHSRNPKPSWYGESVGHYEAGQLVVDTVGLNDKSFIDNYRTPHTTQLHVVERFSLTGGGNTLQVEIEVEDPGAFNTSWRAVQRFRRWTQGTMAPSACAENNFDYFTYRVEPIPQTAKADF